MKISRLSVSIALSVGLAGYGGVAAADAAAGKAMAHPIA